MADDFTYDVFLSHSSKDKAVVRPLAKRLRADGLRVWFDEWEIYPDNIPAKIEEGLEHSRVLVLFMSAHAFGSDWATLEGQTFRFRDPLNKKRHFIPLRLDTAAIKESLEKFSYVDWLSKEWEQEYLKLLEACRSPAKLLSETHATSQHIAEKVIQLENRSVIFVYAFSLDGKRALSGSSDGLVRVWELETGSDLSVLGDHTFTGYGAAWSPDHRRALTGSSDNTVRLWDVEKGRCLRVLKGHTSRPLCVAWSADQRWALSSSEDTTVRLWDVNTGRCLNVLEGHTDEVWSVVWSADHRRVLSGARDKTLRLWDLKTGRCLRVLEGHTGAILSVAWSTDQRRALSGANDNTVRLWDVETGRCLQILEGHTDFVRCIAWSTDQRYALSGANDNTVRLWDVETGRCLRVLKSHDNWVCSVAWCADHRRAFTGDQGGGVRVWDLGESVVKAGVSGTPAPLLPPAPDQVQYTNAKVLLVGESGAGKTGLSKRLALNDWQPSDSTVGAWATQWKLPVSAGNDVEREIWLWDFGGQADQRLIHQLYMDETALAVLVFDGQKEDLFETLGQWDRDLIRASRQAFSKLLVAGRIDAGGLRVSRTQIDAFRNERGYLQLLETSAKPTSVVRS
jgi:small GTP-binding protein